MFEFDGIVVIATVVIVLIIARQGRRNYLARNQGRVCPTCRAIHPPFAQFCRRCGQRL
jgi:predicted amidophosphoribosyltransferase